MNLTEFFDVSLKRLEKSFQLYLNEPSYPDSTLQDSMIYGVQNGGKRIRPHLVYIVGSSLETPWENLDAPAIAIELIHSYSLIHDDLPCMDNADLRRGKPTCHKVFGDAMATLAGVALQPLAFEILTTHPCTLTNEQRLKMISTLTKAAGAQGMVGGQALDMAGVNSIDALNHMYQLKTGALLEASVELGYLASGIENENIFKSLKHYIKNIGLAFQIQDDLLDVIGDKELTGKTVGLDSANKKMTYPHLLGIDKTKEIIQSLFNEALDSIKTLGKNVSLLDQLAHHLLKRNF
jgi:farnesyl diphosphate synthase